MSRGKAENRGLVISVEGDRYYAVSSDGRYVEFQTAGKAPQVGEYITLPPARTSGMSSIAFRWGRMAVAAAVVLATGLGLAAAVTLRQPAAYVAIDINPSMEIAVNISGTVVAFEPLNPEGRAVLEAASSRSGIIRRPVEDALQAIIDAACAGQYLLPSQDNYVQIAISSRAAYSSDPARIREAVDAAMDRNAVSAYLKVRETGLEARKEARDRKTSVNLYLLERDLEAKGVTVKPEGGQRSLKEMIREAGRRGVFGEADLAGKPKQPARPEQPGEPKPDSRPQQDGKPEPAGRPQKGGEPKPAGRPQQAGGQQSDGEASENGSGATKPSAMEPGTPEPDRQTPGNPPEKTEGSPESAPGSPSPQPKESKNRKSGKT